MIIFEDASYLLLIHFAQRKQAKLIIKIKHCRSILRISRHNDKPNKLSFCHMLPGTRAVELRKTNGIYKRLMEERLIKTLLHHHTLLKHFYTLAHCHFFGIFFLSIFFLSQVFLYRGSLIFIGWFL